MTFHCREHQVIAERWGPLLGRHRLVGIEGVYAPGLGVRITGGRTSEVRRIELDRAEGFGASLYLKKYWFPTFRHRWKGALRGTWLGRSKVRREYENLGRLRDLGLEAPEPVAYGEERCWGWLKRSYLISAGVPEACPLDAYIRDVMAAQPKGQAAATRHELIDRLADCARRMHEQRFVHQDFFWRNILLSQGSLEHFYLIDSHQGHGWRTGEGWRFRLQDLATLDAPAPAFFRRTERLRFFLRYRGQGRGRLSASDKWRLRRVLAAADRQRARELRRVRGPAHRVDPVPARPAGD